jgi:hypothetical protein
MLRLDAAMASTGGREMMTFQSGERAEYSGDYVCDLCGEQVFVTRGDSIPRCPNCGNFTYTEQPEDMSREGMY